MQISRVGDRFPKFFSIVIRSQGQIYSEDPYGSIRACHIQGIFRILVRLHFIVINFVAAKRRIKNKNEIKYMEKSLRFFLGWDWMQKIL